MWKYFHNNEVMIEEYLKNLWLSRREAEIFQTLLVLGNKPASTIAKYLWYERTSVYKILQRLTKENLVYETYKNGIKHFFIPDINVLKNYSEEKTKKYQKLSRDYDTVKTQLESLWSKKEHDLPTITLFDSSQWIKNMHKDILETTLSHKYISIRLFASNIVDSQIHISDEMKQSSEELFRNLQEQKVSIESFLGNGIMLMENISKTHDIWIISQIPASNSAINIYLVWQSIYIIIFKDSPFWIKIESTDLASTFHFLLDNVHYTSKL